MHTIYNGNRIIIRRIYIIRCDSTLLYIINRSEVKVYDQMSKCPNAQMSKCPNMQICKCPNMRIFKLRKEYQGCKYGGMHTIYNGNRIIIRRIYIIRCDSTLLYIINRRFIIKCPNMQIFKLRKEYQGCKYGGMNTMYNGNRIINRSEGLLSNVKISNVKIIKCQNIKISKLSNVKISKYQNNIFLLQNLQIRSITL